MTIFKSMVGGDEMDNDWNSVGYVREISPSRDKIIIETMEGNRYQYQTEPDDMLSIGDMVCVETQPDGKYQITKLNDNETTEWDPSEAWIRGNGAKRHARIYTWICISTIAWAIILPSPYGLMISLTIMLLSIYSVHNR